MNARARRGVMKPVLLAVALVLVTANPVAARAAEQKQPPYPCQVLHNEQKKCPFKNCNARIVERLRRECLQGGGRP